MGNVIQKIQSCRYRMKHLTNVFDGPEPRVLILGLDGAGKTNLLYKAELDDAIFANVPPRGINIEMMTPRRGARIQVYDMPGNKLTRYLWQNWFRATEAIVYVVDSADNVRIDEAKFELHDMLKSRDLRRVPLIVVANKQDADDAMATEVVSAELDLTTIQDRDWSIHATSALKGTGVMHVFKDVVDKIKAFRHYKTCLTVKPADTKEKQEKSKSFHQETDIEFTNIEIKDDNDNEKSHSLFESIKKQQEMKAEETEITSAAVSGGSTDSNPPEYDRPSVEYDIDQEETDMRTHPPDTVNDLVTTQTTENVKVTDLDEDTTDSESDDVEDKNDGNTEASSVFEFEANAPVAVV